MAAVTQSQRAETSSRSRSSSSDLAKGRRNAKARQKTKLPAKQYDSSEWKQMRGIITQLYCDNRVTVAELIRRLHGMGFEVNERMLHTRIRKWKIGRNHKFSEMRMAAHRLAEYLDRQQQHSTSSGSSPTLTASKRVTMPSFEIRGERVNYMELMRYFRRKKISDPVSWVKGQKDKLDLSEDVVLIDADPAAAGEARYSEDDGDASDGDNEDFQLVIDQTGQTDLGNTVPMLTTTHQISNVGGFDDQYSTLMGAVQHTDINSSLFSVPPFLRPQTSYALEQLNHSMMIYMSSYLSSPTSATLSEPVVHAHTVHAIFASKMQDGIFLLAKVAPNTAKTRLKGPEPNAAKAFTSFESGFELIHKVLANHSPMSLALMLSIVCELAERAAKTGMKTSAVGILLAKLLSYTHDMAEAVLGSKHPLTVFFYILAQEYICPTVLPSSGSLPLVELILTSLELALAQFNYSSSSVPSNASGRIQDWKQLYLCERLCDALYYCGPTYQVTRSSMRRRLFHDQEARYGPTARNVLWTLTNVADDCLDNGEVDQAIEHFQEALNRAETLTEGYGRAKTSFAAREGLGKCWMRKAEEAEAEARWQQGQSQGQGCGQSLFYPTRTSSDHYYPESSPGSACCSCRCHYAAESKPSSSGSSTDNTGTSTPTSSGSSFMNPTLKPCRTTKSHGWSQNLHQYKLGSRHHHAPFAHKKRIQYLTRAHGYFVEAENEARTYFEASSRRITRVSLRRQEVAELLEIVATPESSSCSGSGSEDEACDMSAGADVSLHPSTTTTSTTNISLVLGFSSDFDFDPLSVSAPRGLAMPTPTTAATTTTTTTTVKPPAMANVSAGVRGFRQQQVDVPLYGRV